MTHYQLLGLDPGATQDHVRAAYRRVCVTADPSVGGDDTAWEQIQEAFRILSNARLRAGYDRTLASGRRVIGGDYLLLKQLANGALGGTYLARDLTLGKLVVVKHCSKLSAEHQGLLRDEARKMFDLDHHAIPTIRRLVELDDGSLALVMGYKEGQTVEQAVASFGTLHPEAVTWIALRVLNALWFVHHRGVVHGALEPHNIIVGSAPAWPISVVDFGLSQVADAPSTRPVGYIESFSPPEQIHGQALVPESDHFSLGATMIYMLTGGDLEAVKARNIPERINADLAAFVNKLLIDDVLSRPRDARDLFNELSGLRNQLFEIAPNHTRGLRSA